jgi:hypothetical protein
VAPRIQEQHLQAIEAAVRHYPEGVTAQQIADSLESPPPRRTLQYRLKSLVDSGRLVMEGEGRWARYRLPEIQEAVGRAAGTARAEAKGEAVLPLSDPGAEIQSYVRRPPERRKPVGYNGDFLDSYRPNETFYLSAAKRKHLRDVGTPKIAEQSAGTYAKQILNRLLIDLSWNSSRLEGNTYSLLDTKRLIASTATRSSTSMGCWRTTCWPIPTPRAASGISLSGSSARSFTRWKYRSSSKSPSTSFSRRPRRSPTRSSRRSS